ncbi:MAG TPA: flagellar export protein FliJ [Gaiellales bacterium]|nr:flagellar export protein FliJ [Gaiellales bacterium]
MENTQFTFRLEPIRALRQQAERQAQEALARELRRQRDRETELDAATRRVDDARGTGDLRPGTEVSGQDLRAFQAYMERVERERDAAEHGVAAQALEVDAGRSRLARASIEHETLVRLKARKRTEHDRAVARAQTARLDEIAIARHVRLRREEAA